MAGVFDALLLNVRLALAAPEALGVKVTLNVADWPAGIVTGNEMPESVNSLLVLLADETVTADPEALRLPPNDALDPTDTVPKLSEVGETANWPCPVPVPENAMLSGEFEAVEITAIVPLAEPVLVGANVAVNVTLWFVARVAGSVSPLIENGADTPLTCEIVTDDPPVLVMVSDKFALLPTSTLPKPRLEGLGLNVPAVMPVPERAIFRLGFDPFEVMLTLPLTAPPEVGENFTVNEVLWPGVKVTGRVSPLMLKPVPLAAAAEIVTLVPPLLVRVSDWLLDVPSCTLPNEMLEGFGERLPCVTPVPDSGMFRLGFDPFEVMLTLPVTLPTADGENFTVNEVLWPEVKVTGRVRPLMLKPVPLAAAAEMVTVVPPLLVRVSDWLLVMPSCTLPNEMLEGLGTRSPCATPVPESGTARFGFDPVDAMLNVALAAPVAVGLNSTENDVLWPAFSVTGSVSPLRLKFAPVIEAAVMVRLEPPELVRDPLSEDDVLT